MEPEKAMADFLERVSAYEKVYQVRTSAVTLRSDIVKFLIDQIQNSKLQCVYISYSIDVNIAFLQNIFVDH